MITHEDLAQEALNKWPTIDPARLARAVDIAKKGIIILARIDERGEPIEPPTIAAYAVKSQTRPRKGETRTWYIVRPREHKCNCKDAEKENICKHRLAVWLHTEFLKRTAAEATARMRRPHPVPEAGSLRETETVRQLGY